MTLAPLAFIQGHSQSKIVRARAQVLSLSQLTQDLSNGEPIAIVKTYSELCLLESLCTQSLLFVFEKLHCDLQVFPANFYSLLTFYPSQQLHGKSFTQQIPSSSFLLLGGPKLTRSMILISLWTNSSRNTRRQKWPISEMRVDINTDLKKDSNRILCMFSKKEERLTKVWSYFWARQSFSIVP